jgi:hypothetical protein
MITVCLSATVLAWDPDFHFNVTYLMAREVGFGDEFAKVIASRSAWTDASILSGPFLLRKTRQLNHFNGPQPTDNFDGEAEAGLANWFKTHVANVSQPDNPFPDAFFMDALKRDDLESALGHLHSVQDKEPHSKFYAQMGHPLQGHWPDRFWLTPDKFAVSVRQSFRVLYAIRQLVPVEFLDFAHANSFTKNKKPEDLNNPDLLAERFLNSPEISQIVHTDFLRHPLYVKTAIASFIEGLKVRGVVAQDLDLAYLLPKDMHIDGSMDFYQVMRKILIDGEFMKDNNGDPIFRMELLMPKVFPEFATFEEAEKAYLDRALRTLQASDDNKDVPSTVLTEEARQISREQIANRITSYLAKASVPEALNRINYVDMFEDDTLRNLEMALRVEAWNKVSKDHYGHKVGFKTYLLRNVGILGKILQNVPRLSKELFVNRHDYNNLADGEVEMVTVNHTGRMNWLRRQWVHVLGASWKYLYSPKFLQGAYDYESQEKFQSLLRTGKIHAITAADIQRMSNQDPGLVDKAIRTVQSWLEKLGTEKSVTLDPDYIAKLNQTGQSAPQCKEVFTP